jgi:hypothetical protein
MVAFAISSHGSNARDSSLCVSCCTCSPPRFSYYWVSGQADKPEREASLIQRVSSADLGGRGHLADNDLAADEVYGNNSKRDGPSQAGSARHATSSSAFQSAL